MPSLLWLVRDQKLSFKDKHGNDLVENEYLELTLSGIAKSTSRKLSNTRDRIMRMFPDRELFCVGNPMGHELDDDPGDMQSVEPENLSDKFTQDVEWLK
jgi:hypothetical protein